MRSLMALLKPVWHNDAGQDLAEWALIIALLLVFAIGILKFARILH